MPENTAPTTKKIERPIFGPDQNSSIPGTGRKRSAMTAITAKTARVRNWRLRYAAAPSWTAPAISCIFSVPSLAAST